MSDKNANTKTMEDLTAALIVRAEHILSNPARFKNKDGAIKLTRIAKASSIVAKWLKGRLSKNRRLGMRLFSRAHHHVDLYEQLQNYAEEMKTAGKELSVAHALLVERNKVLESRLDEIADLFESRLDRCGTHITLLSKEVADLRKKIPHPKEEGTSV